MPTPAPRARRVAAIRRRVAAAAAALFLASLGAVVAWGRQPATPVASSAPAAADQPDATAAGTLQGSGADQPQSADPAPLTSRSS